jgi:hypothetical protein
MALRLCASLVRWNGFTHIWLRDGAARVAIAKKYGTIP